MSNEITTKQQYEIDPFEKYSNKISSRGNITGNLIRFNKQGEYLAGSEKTEIPIGSRMLVYMPSMNVGWVKWWDNKPVQHVLGLVMEDYEAPERNELGDMDSESWETLGDKPIDPWQPVNYLVMCDEEGELFTFATSSKGGLSAVGELAKAYARRRRMKPDEIPIIELGTRSYQHNIKAYGTIINPKFTITGWTKIPDTFDEVANALAGGENVDALEAPAEVAEVETEVVEPAYVEPPPRVVVKAAPKPAPKSVAKPAQKPKKGGRSLRF